jgi:hypothetical protein
MICTHFVGELRTSLFQTYVVGIFACAVLVGQCSAYGGDVAAASQITQSEYVKWLIKARGDSRSAGTLATSDLLAWATAKNIQPTGGWKMDSPLTRDAFVTTLAQMLGVADSADPEKALAKKGVAIGKNEVITRAMVVRTLSTPGFRTLAAIGSRNKGSPVHPAKVTLCHNGHTIQVSPKAVDAHLAHGDTLGPCPP